MLIKINQKIMFVNNLNIFSKKDPSNTYSFQTSVNVLKLELISIMFRKTKI